MLHNYNAHARNSNAKNRALKLLMPPASPWGMSFSDVIKHEYKCLEDASVLAAECRHTWKKMPMHLSSASGRSWYREKPCEIKPQVHILQLKLFLSELKFLMEFAGFERKMDVIYVYAVEGYHIPFLANLFPNLTFYLYGSQRFCDELRRVKNIFIISGQMKMFTTAEATWWGENNSKQKLLLISHMQSGAPGKTGRDFDSCAKHMSDQLEWCRAMQPSAAMLKFHLSYKPEKTTWLAPCSNKHLWIAPFSSKSGTELRLVTTDPWKMQEYDNTAIEEQMYYFNNFTRVCQYGVSIPRFSESPMKDALHMDDCWDCCSMREICMEFLSKKYEQEYGPTLEVREVIRAAVYHLSPLPDEMCDIISKYTSGIGEQEMFEFIEAVIKNSGTNASRKMEKYPHGILAHGEQWITRMHKFRNLHIVIKSNKPRLSSSVVDEIYKLYTSCGDKTLAVGIYPVKL
jgi:hypothetical protein